MAITIRDVALAAGVHISTVSRALSNPSKVKPETRDRVLQAAERLGYSVNPAARSLITGRTHNLGLIVADIANPFFAPLIKAAEGRARAQGYHVFIAETDEDPAVETDVIRALAKQVDGIVWCSSRVSNADIQKLTEVPLVVVNREVAGMPNVLMDVADGADQAVRHLVQLGHTRLALLGGPPASWAGKEIRRVAVQSAESAGANLVVLGPNVPNEVGGAQAAEKVLQSGVTAVLAYNDLMAIGLVAGLADLGVAVPDQLSVIGIDDIAASRFTTPKLTTLAMPKAAAGRAAVDVLLQEDPEITTSIKLGTRLIVRDSTALHRG